MLFVFSQQPAAVLDMVISVAAAQGKMDFTKSALVWFVLANNQCCTFKYVLSIVLLNSVAAAHNVTRPVALFTFNLSAMHSWVQNDCNFFRRTAMTLKFHAVIAPQNWETDHHAINRIGNSYALHQQFTCKLTYLIYFQRSPKSDRNQ